MFWQVGWEKAWTIEKEEKRKRKKEWVGGGVGGGWGNSGMISLAVYLLLPFPKKINVGLCAVSHTVSVCVCACSRVVLICLHHSSASLLPLLLLLWLASGIIERDIYQNRSCICRRWPEQCRLRPPIPTRLWPSAVSSAWNSGTASLGQYKVERRRSTLRANGILMLRFQTFIMQRRRIMGDAAVPSRLA